MQSERSLGLQGTVEPVEIYSHRGVLHYLEHTAAKPRRRDNIRITIRYIFPIQHASEPTCTSWDISTGCLEFGENTIRETAM
ncbi:hypothetical protein chiPu_0006011 [Chiloscyllium punctatum]|uniref:Uncharacterized protein n=1 Tax=Chiloscyllium punctatum TaxID=137246 RepID=A0A401SB26_CHIPU|nr:hypothetical protein [Chiloscyllium punctatum]